MVNSAWEMPEEAKGPVALEACNVMVPVRNMVVGVKALVEPFPELLRHELMPGAHTFIWY